jgi:hypothetical protein
MKAQKFITAATNDPTETLPEEIEFNGWTTKNITTTSARKPQAMHQGLISTGLFI